MGKFRSIDPIGFCFTCLVFKKECSSIPPHHVTDKTVLWFRLILAILTRSNKLAPTVMVSVVETHRPLSMTTVNELHTVNILNFSSSSFRVFAWACAAAAAVFCRFLYSVSSALILFLASPATLCMFSCAIVLVSSSAWKEWCHH